MRLIDADALKESFRKQTVNVQDKIKEDADAIIEAICKDIDLALTVDAAPVVRCEKCAYHSDILLKGMEDFVWCNFFNLYRCKDSFCNCGLVE